MDFSACPLPHANSTQGYRFCREVILLTSSTCADYSATYSLLPFLYCLSCDIPLGIPETTAPAVISPQLLRSFVSRDHP